MIAVNTREKRQIASLWDIAEKTHHTHTAWQSAENESESLSHQCHVCLQNLCKSWYAFAASFIGDIAEGFCEGHLPFASLGWGYMKDLSGKWHFFPLVILSNLWVKNAKSKIKIDVITLQSVLIGAGE